MGGFSEELLRRIANRAQDPRRRTHLAGATASAQPLDLGSLLGDLKKHAPPQAQGLGTALGGLQSLMGGLLGGKGMMMVGPGASPGGTQTFRMGGEADATPGAAPSADELAAAEAAIGRALPLGLKQLYAISDGGFGPGEGLFSLAEMVERYRDMTSEPFGPAGQDWPARLLPLFNEDPVLVCLDLDSGEVTAWDPEEIEDEASEADWQRSFKADHPDLAALMEHWLGAPTFEEQHAAMRAEMLADPMAVHVKNMIESLGRMSPDERARAGFSGDNWEEKVRNRFK